MGQTASTCCFSKRRASNENQTIQKETRKEPQKSRMTADTDPRNSKVADQNGHNLNLLLKEYKLKRIKEQQKKMQAESGQERPIKKGERRNQHAELINLESQKQLGINSFTLLLTLGEGGFGKVFLGCLKKDFMKSEKPMYAIKQLNKLEVRQKKVLENIKLEKRILQESNSPFITRMHSTFRDDSYYYIVMEWAQGGDVQSFIKEGSERRKIYLQNKDECIRFVLGCVILGLEHLHSKNIVYSDLKPSNILIFDDGYAKLADFGVSKQLKKDIPCTFQNGTRRYFSPEMVVGAECKRFVDLWALGVLAYQISNYDFPFRNQDIQDDQRFEKVVEEASKNREWKNNFISDQLKDFINRLLKVQAKERLGANGWEAIKNHSLFRSVKFDWRALEGKAMRSPLLPIISHVIDYEAAVKPRISKDTNKEVDLNLTNNRLQTIKDWSAVIIDDDD